MKLNSYIDHTLLKQDSLLLEVQQLCAEAIEHQFAAVCIAPPFVKQAKKILPETIKTATVIGFPMGYSATEAKLSEIVLALADGADELDIVINILALKNNDWSYLAQEINALLPIINHHKKCTKIIIESGILTETEIIKCCELYGAAPVDYLKTSTGYAKTGATEQAVLLMRQHLPKHIQIKASGGIKTAELARTLIAAGATRLGCSASVAIVSE